jgi:hypothetical protein
MCLHYTDDCKQQFNWMTQGNREEHNVKQIHFKTTQDEKHVVWDLRSEVLTVMNIKVTIYGL